MAFQQKMKSGIWKGAAWLPMWRGGFNGWRTYYFYFVNGREVYLGNRRAQR